MINEIGFLTHVLRKGKMHITPYNRRNLHQTTIFKLFLHKILLFLFYLCIKSVYFICITTPYILFYICIKSPKIYHYSFLKIFLLWTLSLLWNNSKSLHSCGYSYYVLIRDIEIAKSLHVNVNLDSFFNLTMFLVQSN